MTNRDKPDFTVTEFIDLLRPVAEELNKESDEATKILKDFEEALNVLNLGVNAWVKKGNLGYGQHRGRWGLIVTEPSYSPDKVFTYKRLLDSNRTTRIATLPLLPELIKELKIAADATLKGFVDNDQ